MVKKKYRQYDTLLIKWDDAAGSQGWNKNEQRLMEPHNVNTVGFFIARNDRRTLICMNHAWEEDNRGDYMSIPNGMIRHIEVLKRATK